MYVRLPLTKSMVGVERTTYAVTSAMHYNFRHYVMVRDVQLNGPTAVKLSTVTFLDNTLDIQCTPHIQLDINIKNQGKKSVLLPLKSSSDSEVSHPGGDQGKLRVLKKRRRRAWYCAVSAIIVKMDLLMKRPATMKCMMY